MAEVERDIERMEHARKALLLVNCPVLLVLLQHRPIRRTIRM